MADNLFDRKPGSRDGKPYKRTRRPGSLLPATKSSTVQVAIDGTQWDVEAVDEATGFVWCAVLCRSQETMGNG